MTILYLKKALVCLAYCSLFLSHAYAQTTEKITLLYPEVNPPFDKIFTQIADGITKEYSGEVILMGLPSSFDSSAEAKKIRTNKVIALGKRGFRVAKEIYTQKHVLVGALPIKPNGIGGVSLMASPNTLFDTLTDLAPEIDTVNVLYSQASAWVIKEASQSAKEKNLQLNAIKVDNLQSAVKAYNQLFNGAQPNTAIWLPLDPITANEKIVVPAILEKAWKSKMVVFSSKPTHAKRGALFSALPDNTQLGKQLAQLINTADFTATPSTVNTLANIQLAVNLRTAAHLGLEYSSDTRSRFTLTFPSK